jgi:mannose-6-phosphate isomerase-like protein (cupin superfamily)
MRRVEKPWGHELIWAQTDRYAGKLLRIEPGQALSVQYHERKMETVYVLRGALRIHLADAPGQPLSLTVLGPGEAFDVMPGVVHSFAAGDEAVELIEVSSPELDDVVRLSDRYGRQGTTEP